MLGSWACLQGVGLLIALQQGVAPLAGGRVPQEVHDRPLPVSRCLQQATEGVWLPLLPAYEKMRGAQGSDNWLPEVWTHHGLSNAAAAWLAWLKR